MLCAYVSQPSCRAGESATLHASGDVGRVSVRVERQGPSAETTALLEGVPVEPLDVPASAIEAGCGWPPVAEIRTETGWRSGFYLIRLEGGGEVAHAMLVVRPARRRSERVLIVTTTTYQAYNDFGGANAYSRGQPYYEGGAPVLSWRRPFAPGFLWKPPGAPRLADKTPPPDIPPVLDWAWRTGSSVWSAASGWPASEQPFVLWAENEGYAFDYLTSHDLDRDPTCLDGYALAVAAGHDEYWSWRMRDTAEAFIERGGNFCFFSGNSVFWQVRLDSEGTMTAYKADWRNDPLYATADRRLTTGLWSNPVTERPENTLTGVSFAHGGYARTMGASPRGAGGFFVCRPSHWIFENTELRYGDMIGAETVLAGYELDGCDITLRRGLPVATGRDGTPADFLPLALAPAQLLRRDLAPMLYPEDAMSDFDVVVDQVASSAASPFDVEDFRQGFGVMGVREGPAGAVFTASTTEWGAALAGGDALVAQMTRNLLDRLGAPRSEGGPDDRP